MENRIVSRRTFVAVTAAALGSIALSGCSGGAQQSASSASGTSAQASSSSQATSDAQASSQPTSSSAQIDSSAVTSAQASSSATDTQASSGAATSSAASSDAAATSGAKIAVACFSATGNTRAVAQHLVAHLGADYIEIEAAEPYTDEDLNYHDETTRATMEQNDPATRPALAAMPDFSAYDTVFLGHPIWWGKAPRLICTMLEGCDLAGKKVAEFCTSGSSGVEGATGELTELSPGAEWIGAMRFAAGAAEAEVGEWADSLGVQ